MHTFTHPPTPTPPFTRTRTHARTHTSATSARSLTGLSLCSFAATYARLSFRFRGRRLPTEAEWEAACVGKAGGDGRLQWPLQKTMYPWGDDHPEPHRCNIDGYRGNLLDVAALPDGDSAFGCRQMMGQVWEWTATAFYPYPGFLPDYPCVVPCACSVCHCRRRVRVRVRVCVRVRVHVRVLHLPLSPSCAPSCAPPLSPPGLVAAPSCVLCRHCRLFALTLCALHWLRYATMRATSIRWPSGWCRKVPSFVQVSNLSFDLCGSCRVYDGLQVPREQLPLVRVPQGEQQIRSSQSPVNSRRTFVHGVGSVHDNHRVAHTHCSWRWRSHWCWCCPQFMLAAHARRS